MVTFFNKPQYRHTGGRSRKREIPEGLWTKCPECGEVIFNRELEDNLMVCPKCDFHMSIPARERLLSLCDTKSFKELDQNLFSVDALKFKGVASYTDRLKSYKKRTGLKDAVVSGWGEIEGRRVSLAVMDFGFLGGSMGAVVGEKITRAIERGIHEKTPVIVISASGGARMYEGMFSLMQMAKTSGALAKLAQKKQAFISILTNPTMAGVMASFASLGDLIISEPRAMVGFAGTRVIRETTQQELPKGFQTAEFLLEHGLIDMIISRKQMRESLGQILRYF
jgi:acetyl-CoA carboxylase carboxyl transferase subunit beta